jgi:hypothetical protein
MLRCEGLFDGTEHDPAGELAYAISMLRDLAESCRKLVNWPPRWSTVMPNGNLISIYLRQNNTEIILRRREGYPPFPSRRSLDRKQARRKTPRRSQEASPASVPPMPGSSFSQRSTRSPGRRAGVTIEAGRLQPPAPLGLMINSGRS